MRSPGGRRGDLKQEVRSGIGKRGGGGQQEDFKRAPGKEGRSIGTWREQDGGPVSPTEVDGIGALPILYKPSMRVSLVLASGCQSQNIIADTVGPDTFTFEDLLLLLTSAVGQAVP